MVTRGRWARQKRLLVCRSSRLEGVQKMPRGPAGCILRRVMGRLLRESSRRGETRLSCLLHRGTVPPVQRESAGPRGARDAVCRRRLPRDSAGAVDRSDADTVKIETRKTGSILTACAVSDCALGEPRLRGSRLLSTQIVRKQAKAIRLQQRCNCVQHCRQRLPRV